MNSTQIHAWLKALCEYAEEHGDPDMFDDLELEYNDAIVKLKNVAEKIREKVIELEIYKPL